jgi:hypothetical protein
MTVNGVAPPTRAHSLRRLVLHGFLYGIVVGGGLHFGYVFFGPNFHTVLPGQVYRCAQLDASTLAWLIQWHHVRTVLNLRGFSDPTPWYLAECRATSGQDVSQEDVGLSAGRLPPVPAVRQLIEVLDHAERPLLIHCNKGIDRTGMVSTMALLLYTDAGLDEARRQLGAMHGHLPLGRTGNMDRFFDLYADWLAANGLGHSRAHFRRWAEREYCPGECRAMIEVLEPKTEDRRPKTEDRADFFRSSVLGPRSSVLLLPRDRTGVLRVRCTNTSVQPWVLRPESNAGVHARFLLSDAEDQQLTSGMAGLFHAVVPPGDSIDLTLALPPVHVPGRYVLRVDMVDGQGSSFYQFGYEPLFCEVEVP